MRPSDARLTDEFRSRGQLPEPADRRYSRPYEAERRVTGPPVRTDSDPYQEGGVGIAPYRMQDDAELFAWNHGGMNQEVEGGRASE